MHQSRYSEADEKGKYDVMDKPCEQNGKFPRIFRKSKSQIRFLNIFSINDKIEVIKTK